MLLIASIVTVPTQAPYNYCMHNMTVFWLFWVKDMYITRVANPVILCKTQPATSSKTQPATSSKTRVENIVFVYKTRVENIVFVYKTRVENLVILNVNMYMTRVESLVNSPRMAINVYNFVIPIGSNVVNMCLS